MNWQLWIILGIGIFGLYLAVREIIYRFKKKNQVKVNIAYAIGVTIFFFPLGVISTIASALAISRSFSFFASFSDSEIVEGISDVIASIGFAAIASIAAYQIFDAFRLKNDI